MSARESKSMMMRWAVGWRRFVRKELPPVGWLKKGGAEGGEGLFLYVGTGAERRTVLLIFMQKI